MGELVGVDDGVRPHICGSRLCEHRASLASVYFLSSVVLPTNPHSVQTWLQTYAASASDICRFQRRLPACGRGAADKPRRRAKKTCTPALSRAKGVCWGRRKTPRRRAEKEMCSPALPRSKGICWP